LVPLIDHARALQNHACHPWESVEPVDDHAQAFVNHTSDQCKRPLHNVKLFQISWAWVVSKSRPGKTQPVELRFKLLGEQERQQCRLILVLNREGHGHLVPRLQTYLFGTLPSEYRSRILVRDGKRRHDCRMTERCFDL
jgi:hypothetical protein